MEQQPPKPVYTNVVRMTSGPYDLTIDFGFMEPREGAEPNEPPEFDVVSRVVMSLSHAKTMLPLLARMIANYESEAGPIPAPGFRDQE